MEFTRERLRIIIVGTILAVLFGPYLFLYRPLINRCRQEGAKCMSAEEKVLLAREAITNFLNQNISEKHLISEEDVSLAIDELTKQARSNGINFVSITPGQIKKAENYPCKVLPIEMETESTYKGLGIFLGSADDLEKSLVTVRDFSLTSHKKDAGKLTTRLVINMHLSGQDEE